jgi:hypothetical protein
MSLVDSIGRFKVVKCRCGFVCSTSSNSVFKCFGCGRSSKIIRKASGLVLSHLGVKVLFSSDSEREVGVFVRKYQELVYSGDVKNDFHSYKRGDK